MTTEPNTPRPPSDEPLRRKRHAVEMLRSSLFNSTATRAEGVIEAIALAFGIEPVDRQVPRRQDSAA